MIVGYLSCHTPGTTIDGHDVSWPRVSDHQSYIMSCKLMSYHIRYDEYDSTQWWNQPPPLGSRNHHPRLTYLVLGSALYAWVGERWHWSCFSCSQSTPVCVSKTQSPFIYHVILIHDVQWYTMIYQTSYMKLLSNILHSTSRPAVLQLGPESLPFLDAVRPHVLSNWCLP